MLSKRLKVVVHTIGGVCVFLFALSSYAAPPLPTPGEIITPIDKPVYQPERATTPKIERPENPPAPAASQSTLKVRVDSFKFEGNTTFSDEELKSFIAEFEGSNLSIAEIYHVADVVEANYRYRGYLLTSVYVPAQKINSGTIILEVIEGRLGKVKIDGKLDSYSEEFLLYQADGLQPGEIISDDELEKETLLLSDLPGLDVRAVITPGEEYGTSDVVFITEEDRYSGTFSTNNYGRKSVGEYRVEGGLLIANPILQGDVLNLSAIVAQNSRMYYGRADYDALINRSGSRMGFSLSAFKYDVDTNELGLTGVDLGGNGTTMVLRSSHPIQRSTRNNTTIAANIRRSNSKETGNNPLQRPESTIYLLEVFLNWDHLYRKQARTAISGGLITNFKTRSDILDTSSQKMKLTFDVSHYQPFMETWFTTARVQGVYSPDPLVDVEKFRLGGQGSVRAYPSADIAGDRGAAISLDVGKNYQYSGNVITPRVFVDAGKVFRDDAFVLVGQPSVESLSGFGAGLSVVIVKKHTIDFEVVKPISGKTSSDGRDTRFWLGYRGMF